MAYRRVLHDMTKYVFVTGGVVSSLGKGIASASLAAILESRGLIDRSLAQDILAEVNQSGKEIAEAFASTRITNPLFRAMHIEKDLP